MNGGSLKESFMESFMPVWGIFGCSPSGFWGDRKEVLQFRWRINEMAEVMKHPFHYVVNGHSIIDRGPLSTVRYVLTPSINHPRPYLNLNSKGNFNNLAPWKFTPSVTFYSVTSFKDSSEEAHLNYLSLHCFAFFFPSTCNVSCPRLTYAFSHSKKHESIAGEACKEHTFPKYFIFPSFIELVSSRFASLLATKGPFTPRRWLITDHCWGFENAKIAMKNKIKGEKGEDVFRVTAACIKI